MADASDPPSRRGIRWCHDCREDVSEAIFERVPGLWRGYREGGRVDKRAEVFHLVHHVVPSALGCILTDDLRPHFEAQGSTGQGVPASSPRYTFPTRGTPREGIFICTQYEARRDGQLGDYLLSIIVGRDGLKKHTEAPSRALREIVGAAREILGVSQSFEPSPQGRYRREIVHQHRFERRDPPTSEKFRSEIEGLFRRVVDRKDDLDRLWDEVTRRAGDYEPEFDWREAHRKGNRGERYVIRIERAGLERSGRPDLAREVRKVPARGPNHDILTYRWRDGAFREHYIEVKTTEDVEFRGTISRLQTQFALQHPEKTSLVIVPSERRGRPIGEYRELVSLDEREHYLHPEILGRWPDRGRRSIPPRTAGASRESRRPGA